MDFSKYTIDKKTPIPLYFQLKSIITKALDDGALTAGDSLPTEAEFSEMFGLSRTTVRQAIGELVSEGKVYREKSKGTFVSGPKIVSSFMQNLDSFSVQMQEQNFIPRVELLSKTVEEAPTEVAKALGLEEGTKLIHIYRRRYANDEPIILTHNFLPLYCDYLMDTDFEKVALYETVFNHHPNIITRFVRTIQATLASRELADLLCVEVGHPVQHATSVGYNAKSEPIDYAIVDYRGDKNIFVVQFNAEGKKNK